MAKVESRSQRQRVRRASRGTVRQPRQDQGPSCGGAEEEGLRAAGRETASAAARGPRALPARPGPARTCARRAPAPPPGPAAPAPMAALCTACRALETRSAAHGSAGRGSGGREAGAGPGPGRPARPARQPAPQRDRASPRLWRGGARGAAPEHPSPKARGSSELVTLGRLHPARQPPPGQAARVSAAPVPD